MVYGLLALINLIRGRILHDIQPFLQSSDSVGERIEFFDIDSKNLVIAS